MASIDAILANAGGGNVFENAIADIFKNYHEDGGVARNAADLQAMSAPIVSYLERLAKEPAAASKPALLAAYTDAARYFDASVDVLDDNTFPAESSSHAAVEQYELVVRFFRLCRIWAEVRVLAKYAHHARGAVAELAGMKFSWADNMPAGVDPEFGPSPEQTQFVNARISRVSLQYRFKSADARVRLAAIFRFTLPKEVFSREELRVLAELVPRIERCSNVAHQAMLLARERSEYVVNRLWMALVNTPTDFDTTEILSDIIHGVHEE